MTQKNRISRRKFIGSVSAASLAFTVVPRHVLGGPRFVAPSDKLTLGYIGCGTQGLREMTGLIANPNVQIVSVCDPNKSSTDYIDWSPYGIRDGIRKALDDSSWGEGLKGIPGGREVAKDFVDRYYAKDKATKKYKGCSAYEDFRELLEKEKDIDAVKIMTPDHLHATIAIAAMKKGKHVVMHKPIANRIYESRLTIETARQTKVSTHLLAWSNRSANHLVKNWISMGVIGKLKEIHNWSYRPVWPQWSSLPLDKPPIPAGFNWDLWLGPVPDRPYHPNYTHCVFRGWYDFGGGSIADMGHYSLWPLFAAFDINTPPLSAEAYATTTRTVVDQVSKNVVNDVAFPLSSIVRFKFPKQDSFDAFDLFWYDGGMKPPTPPEMEADGKDLPSEGMLFVGDKGKILGGFRNETPVILPESFMKEFSLANPAPAEVNERKDDWWIDAFREKKQPVGNFLMAHPISETINLAAVALRAGKKIMYDPVKMEISNMPEANKFLRREYRAGWEL